MAEVLVKVCGITNLADAQLAVELGAAMLGFNFYLGSARSIAPEAAAKIIAGLPAQVEPVGVFVNAGAAEISHIAAVTGIRAVQLHGDESPADCIAVRELATVRVIKALHTSPGFNPERALLYPADWLLLDAHSEQFGGSGRIADWTMARAVTALLPNVILAGGLSADNVALAVRTVRPHTVDVAGGVESAPGRKDAVRMRAFFRAVAQNQERSKQ